MAASASRTLSICQRRTPIAVQPGSNCHAALRARRTASGYGATGPACQDCSLKSKYTTGPERRIPRWEHEHLLEAVQQRLDANPQAMRLRRETVEHPFDTMKARMGATHFLTKTLPKVAADGKTSRAGRCVVSIDVRNSGISYGFGATATYGVTGPGRGSWAARSSCQG